MNQEILFELNNYIELHRVPETEAVVSEEYFSQCKPCSGFPAGAADKSESIPNEEDQEAEKKFLKRFLKCNNTINEQAKTYDSCTRFEENQPVIHNTEGVSKDKKELEDFIKREKTEETFSTRLLKYIDGTGSSDSEIYKKAGIDRRHFSKIRCDKDYRPKKSTAVAFCLALRLDAGKTEEMLKLAGYSLSNSDISDLVVKFCIEKGIYNLLEVNDALEFFGQKEIGEA